MDVLTGFFSSVDLSFARVAVLSERLAQFIDIVIQPVSREGFAVTDVVWV